MKGATKVPSTKINTPPRPKVIKMMGASHSFLRCRKNVHNSIKRSIGCVAAKIAAGRNPHPNLFLALSSDYLLPLSRALILIRRA